VLGGWKEGDRAVNLTQPQARLRKDSASAPQMETFLGDEQMKWLEKGLVESTSLWKFIVSSVPVSVRRVKKQGVSEGAQQRVF